MAESVTKSTHLIGEWAEDLVGDDDDDEENFFYIDPLSMMELFFLSWI